MLNLLDRIGGAMFAAAWPLSTIGFYGTGATLFPRPSEEPRGRDVDHRFD
jgi:hypothetical protein